MRNILAIVVGAALGALLRWQLGARLNAYYVDVPPGTLAANLIGAYIIGLAMAGFAAIPNLAPEWRLFVMTGFCGGLTTFSTFSAEVITQLQGGRLQTALLAMLLHLGGSLFMTVLGIFSVQLWVAR